MTRPDGRGSRRWSGRERPRSRPGPAPAAILLAAAAGLALALAGCDGDDRATVDVVQRDRAARAGTTTGAVDHVVAELRAAEGAERVVYAPPVDLRRPPGAEPWPPTAEDWPGARTRPDTEEEPARTATSEPTAPTAAADTTGPDTTGPDTTGADPAPADTAPADTAGNDPAPADTAGPMRR